jgi:tryptophan 2,3-dioxygenase
MRDTQLVADLNRLPIYELINVQEQQGRLALPADFRRFWSKQHERASEIINDDGRGLRAKRLASLLRHITFSLATVDPAEKPNYYQYTDAHVLDWFLAPGLSTVSEIRARILLGFWYVLQDLLRVEGWTLGGREENHLVTVSTESIARRLKEINAVFPQIRLLAQQCRLESNWDVDLVHYASLEGYVDESTHLSALVYFSCFPLTQFHDEVVFIRVLHGSELCFFAIRLCLITAIEAMKLADKEVAKQELELAVEFAKLLHLFLKVLRTMPPEHFADFRDYTGKASALQSKAYHELDIYLRGVNFEKRAHFEKIDYLSPLLRYADPRFVSLKDALNKVANDSPWLEVVEIARELDQQLFTWRGLHLGFAKRYIQGGGTGGTEGAGYLEKHLKAGIFDGTTMDWALVAQVFAGDSDVIDELHRISTRTTIAQDPSKRRSPS